MKLLKVLLNIIIAILSIAYPICVYLALDNGIALWNVLIVLVVILFIKLLIEKSKRKFNAIFLVVAFSDKDIQRVNDIQDVAKETEKIHGVQIKVVVVDARADNKMSASKL